MDNLVSERLTYFLEENKELATSLIKKMQRASLAREAARKAREDSRKGKTKNKADLYARLMLEIIYKILDNCIKTRYNKFCE